MCTPQDAEWLANSKCIVDFTSGIFLDPTREETLSANNAYRVRKNRTRVRERLKLLMSTGVPYVLGTDAYHGYLYREVGYAVELGSDIVTALKGVTSNAANGLRTGRPDRKLKERLCRRYHCSGWKSADGCGVPGKRTVCHAGWQHCETEVKRLQLASRNKMKNVEKQSET